MKITKQQLEKLIKESVLNHLKEDRNYDREFMIKRKAFRVAQKNLKQVMKQVVSNLPIAIRNDDTELLTEYSQQMIYLSKILDILYAISWSYLEDNSNLMKWNKKAYKFYLKIIPEISDSLGELQTYLETDWGNQTNYAS